MLSGSEEEFNKAIGFRIMNLRQGHKITQDSLGASLGVRYQQIQKYESGKARVPSYNIAKCAKLFGVPIDYLLLGEDEEKETGYSKIVLNVADEVAKLPSIGIRRAVYTIAKEINVYAEKEETETFDQKLQA